jgi:proteasome lid subunit RPN8/RPN11
LKCRAKITTTLRVAVIHNILLTLRTSHFVNIVAHAREADPAECCGLIGGSESFLAETIYQLRNVALNNHVSYEVAPEELFAAQREMRQRGEQLVAIYHSHPRAAEPEPSETDVRLAYYPSATYLIVGLGGREPVMRAFRISEAERRWERVEYAVADA